MNPELIPILAAILGCVCFALLLGATICVWNLVKRAEAMALRLALAYDACRSVVDNWQDGDLRIAAKMCAEVVERERALMPVGKRE